MINPPPVFIVEDEEAVRSSLARLLRAIGVPTRTFESAESFLEAYGGPEQVVCWWISACPE